MSILFSSVSSSGGGLPGRPGSKELRALVIFSGYYSSDWGPSRLRYSAGLRKNLQLVEIVKLTVILAWVSTASSPM